MIWDTHALTVLGLLYTYPLLTSSAPENIGAKFRYSGIYQIYLYSAKNTRFIIHPNYYPRPQG